MRGANLVMCFIGRYTVALCAPRQRLKKRRVGICLYCPAPEICDVEGYRGKTV